MAAPAARIMDPSRNFSVISAARRCLDITHVEINIGLNAGRPTPREPNVPEEPQERTFLVIWNTESSGSRDKALRLVLEILGHPLSPHEDRQKDGLCRLTSRYLLTRIYIQRGMGSSKRP